MHHEISAGGVVYRESGGQVQLQLICDRYGRMTLAKGKMESGETVEQTALREIREETGIVGRIVEPLAVVSYEYLHPIHGATRKEVHYFLVAALEGDLQPQLEEIDSVAWYSPGEAWARQLEAGYDNNHDVLKKALHKLGVNGGA